MPKLNSLLISLFIGVLTLYGGYNYVGADEPEPAPTPEAALEIESIVKPNEATEVTTEVDELERKLRDGFERENSPEYKAKQDAETKARIQQQKEKQEKSRQQSNKSPVDSIFSLFKYHPILGILAVIVAVIFLIIRDYNKKFKK